MRKCADRHEKAWNGTKGGPRGRKREFAYARAAEKQGRRGLSVMAGTKERTLNKIHRGGIKTAAASFEAKGKLEGEKAGTRSRAKSSGGGRAELKGGKWKRQKGNLKNRYFGIKRGGDIRGKIPGSQTYTRGGKLDYRRGGWSRSQSDLRTKTLFIFGIDIKKKR